MTFIKFQTPHQEFTIQNLYALLWCKLHRSTSSQLGTKLIFRKYAKDAQPEVLVTLIQTIVERIYIVDKDDERYCHIFIKGCSGEDYTGFFQTAGYIEQKTTPVCDSEQYCICTKISETSNIWTDSDRYREHPKKTVRV